MEIGNIIPHIEALIFASDKPLTSIEITELINNAFGFMEEKLTLEQIQTSIDGIREKYASEFYPFEVRESGGGWQFLTKRDFHKTIAQLNGDKFLKRLSSAALETLSIIAYKQPITKGEIESIRGVSSDYSIQKLLEKELIIITGRNEEMPGKPLIYSTSKTFMDYFGINSAADLPKLKEVFAETLVEPTIVNHTPGESLTEEEERQLAVAENGQLVVHAESDEVADGEVTEEIAHSVAGEASEVNEGETIEESDEVGDEVADEVADPALSDEEQGEHEGEEEDVDVDEEEEVEGDEADEDELDEEEEEDEDDEEEDDEKERHDTEHPEK